MLRHRWVKYSLLALSILIPFTILALAIRKRSKRHDFISEDDLKTFEGWLRYQGVDASTTAPEELQKWRGIFDDMEQRIAASPKVGRMKLNPLQPNEYRYAVAVRDGSDLWLVLWVRRSPKGEFFVMVPRGEAFAIMERSGPGRKSRKRDWNPHASYHLDGSLHMKSYDDRVLPPQKCQPLTGKFKGTVHLASFSGHGPRGVGAICDPTDFSGIVVLPPDALGPGHGTITVDLTEPGHEPLSLGANWKVVERQEFQDFLPRVVISALAHDGD
jgi:hypothetical protein